MSFGTTTYGSWLETIILIHEYVHIRSPKRPFTIHCTFRSLLRPKTRIMFTRACLALCGGKKRWEERLFLAEQKTEARSNGLLLPRNGQLVENKALRPCCFETLNLEAVLFRETRTEASYATVQMPNPITSFCKPHHPLMIRRLELSISPKMAPCRPPLPCPIRSPWLNLHQK